MDQQRKSNIQQHVINLHVIAGDIASDFPLLSVALRNAADNLNEQVTQKANSMQEATLLQE